MVDLTAERGSNFISGLGFLLNVKSVLFIEKQEKVSCALGFMLYKADLIYEHVGCALMFQTPDTFNSPWDFRV